MKHTWKIFSHCKLIAYVQVPETCTIFGEFDASLQLVREKLDKDASSGQLLDTKRKEKMLDGIPVYVL